MQANITIAKSWKELNDWQLQEIAHLYLSTEIEDFSEAYIQMIFVVYQKSPDKKSIRFLKKLLKEVPISELEKHTQWLLSTTNFYRFPEISGLIKPADALGNITIKQFSTIDTFFYQWSVDKSIINLKRLVASLYRIKEEYEDIDLSRVDAITRNIPQKQMEAIALAYLFTRMHIADQFPVIFPKKKEPEKEELKPVFKRKDSQYIPFDETIIAMSMDELQPLGIKQDVNKVKIYEFLSVLTKMMLYHKEKAKAYERK